MPAFPARSALPLRILRPAWFMAVALAALAVLAPPPASGPSLSLVSGVTGYPAELVQNVYRLIRVAMPWLPAGMLLTLVLPVPTVRMSTLLAVAAGGVMVLVGSPGSASLTQLRDLLFVIPGLAAGIWLAECSRPSVRPSAPSPMTTTPVSQAGTVGRPLPAVGAGWLIGGVLVASGILLAAGLPRWGPTIAVGLALYTLLIWWRPLAALVVVPAALPMLDLAPWTGRIFLDEFDLLLVTTIGALLLRAPSRPTVQPARFGIALIALFLLCALLSATLGLLPLAPLDANAFSSYWSPYNALRVGKGILWGTALFWMVRHTAPGEALLARSLAVGMGTGLLGVCLVGIWERWLFAGSTGEAGTYRIVSTFSSMHTGGGHIEAYLVAALPFLWLGLFALRSLVLAVPILVLSAYVMLYTVARGGVLAFVVITAILGVATLRTVRGSGFRRAVAPVITLIVVTVVVMVGAGGGHLMQRFERSAQDWDTRVAHWRLAMRIADDSWPARLFGSGLGSFPRRYLERGPVDRQPATIGYVTEQGNTFLRMGVGETLYVAQRVAAESGASYRLSLDVRSGEPDATLATPLCEKLLLDSRRCDWHQLHVPGDGRWHTTTHEFRSATVGFGSSLEHLPVELYFHNPGKRGVIDVDRVSLLDPQGRNLIGNGEFSRGSDFWFFKTHSHLPWHIKNFWVHTLFEMGAVGLLLTGLLAAVASARLARAGWDGSRLAWAFLASLAGLLTVGMFDSIVDAPRLATLLMAWLFLGSSLAWSRPALLR